MRPANVPLTEAAGSIRALAASVQGAAGPGGRAGGQEGCLRPALLGCRAGLGTSAEQAAEERARPAGSSLPAPLLLSPLPGTRGHLGGQGQQPVDCVFSSRSKCLCPSPATRDFCYRVIPHGSHQGRTGKGELPSGLEWTAWDLTVVEAVPVTRCVPAGCQEGPYSLESRPLVPWASRQVRWGAVPHPSSVVLP